MRVANQAFIAGQRGKGKASKNNKSKSTSSNNSKPKKYGDKNNKKGKCNYCRETGHYIKECPKLKEKEAKKKEAGMAVVDASLSHAQSVNLVQDANWAFSVQCCYNPLPHDACFTIAELHVWYFDSGASKHITSQHDMFSSLKSAPAQTILSCLQITPLIQLKELETLYLLLVMVAHSHFWMHCMY